MPFLPRKTRTFRARPRLAGWKKSKCTCLLLMYGRVKSAKQAW